MRIRNEEELARWLAANRRQPSPVALPKRDSQLERQQEPMGPARILGLDVALRCTGWGIIDMHGNNLKAVDCGVIRNGPKETVSACLKRLSLGVRELVGLYHPTISSLEGGFYVSNARTALVLGMARGAVIAVLGEESVPVYEYAPRKVKQAVSGFGDASKQQVALCVAQFLHVQVGQLALDSTDALAMALTHAQRMVVANGLGVGKGI
jgi:crossover junction endodeoxyribonuclease RuvC